MHTHGTHRAHGNEPKWHAHKRGDGRWEVSRDHYFSDRRGETDVETEIDSDFALEADALARVADLNSSMPHVQRAAS